MSRRVWGPAVLGMLLLIVALAPGAQAATTRSRPAEPARAAVAAATKPFDAQLLTLINKRRHAIGCPYLASSKYLVAAAKSHTAKMVKAKKLEHQLPGESGLGQRVTAAGYKNWKGLAENLAKGASTPTAVYNLWMSSSMHKQNMQNCFFHDVGIGVSVSNGTTWVTAVFGRR